MRQWSQLSRDEQIEVRKQMVLCGGQSVNGVAGWYASQRARGTQKKPQPVVRYDGVSVADEPPEPISIDEVRDVLPY